MFGVIKLFDFNLDYFVYLNSWNMLLFGDFYVNLFRKYNVEFWV